MKHWRLRLFSELEEYVEAGSNIMGRFSSTPNELLTSAEMVSGSLFAISGNIIIFHALLIF